MRILITNDDGIGAPGIIALARWAAKLGKVTVAAPSSEQSGRSHAINLTTPYKIKKVPFPDGIEAYSVDSTPADCVRFGLLSLEGGFDLVLSGINRGFNLGDDIGYSGTSARCLRQRTSAVAASRSRPTRAPLRTAGQKHLSYPRHSTAYTAISRSATFFRSAAYGT